MSEIINDWYPETHSLLERLLKAGFVIVNVSNGEDVMSWPKAPDASFSYKAFVEECFSCDESWLRVISPEGDRCALYLVYGNEPGVLVSDYTYTGEAASLDKVTEEHYDAWTGRTQPTKVRVS